MIQALDQTGDVNGQQLYRLSKLYQLPPFVKKASSDDIYGTDQLEAHQYADPAHRMFPCHSGPATYISTLFFMDKRASINPELAQYIDARLDDFAFVHGIGDRITALKTKLAAANPVDNVNDLSDESYALVLEPDETNSGQRERRYPMRNALEVKRAAEYLEEYRDVFPFRLRQKMAMHILEKANTFGAGLGDLDDFLQKQAGMGAAAAYEVSKLIFDRARLLKKAGKLDYAIKMGEVAKTIAGKPASIQDQDALVKLAALVDDVDRETGLNRLVGDLPKPEEVFFNLTEKVASKLRTEHFATSSGNIYKLADMDPLKLPDIRAMLGSDFAAAVSTGGMFVSLEKVAKLVPTLPRGDAELFDQLLSSVGIHPVAKEAAHRDDRFSSDELKALATLHSTV